MTCEKVTDKSAKEYSDKKLEDKGLKGGIEYWNNLIESGLRINKENMAFGQTLYAKCIKAKDTKNAMKIAADLAVIGTETGQTVQSMGMLKLMSPDGQVYVLEKSITKMNKEFRQKLGDKYKDIKLNEDLVREYFEAETDEARNEALDKIQTDIAEQMPTTLAKKRSK